MTSIRFLPLVIALGLSSLLGCGTGSDSGQQKQDADGDGVEAADDCDDSDANVGLPSTWYGDADGDTFGDLGSVVEACTAPEGFVADGQDCDDSNAQISPAAAETCNNLDDDCDGAIDEDADGSGQWFADEDRDGYGNPNVESSACVTPDGYVTDNTDCDDTNADVNPGAWEVCNNVDDDCNTLVDDDPRSADLWYPDADSDGFGDERGASTEACTAPPGTVDNNDDCDDNNAAIRPDATEIVADGIDEDCDGNETCYYDSDRDGYGSITTRESVDADCGDTRESSTSDDCDDEDSSIHPGAEEECDGVDQDCNGAIDDGASDLAPWYLDADHDGYGDTSTVVYTCDPPAGYTSIGYDCDDTDPSIGAMPTWYADLDGDGWGSDSSATRTCTQPDGYVTAGGDCDDTNALANPGLVEICGDGLDNDCDDDPSDCPMTGSRSLSDANARLAGVASGDYAGRSVAAAGDVDGDSYVDMLVGAYGADATGSTSGSAFLVRGPITGDLSLDAAFARFDGQAASDRAGWALCGGADVDGDGLDDIAVGAPYHDGAGSNSGAVYVVTGHPSGSVSLGEATAQILGESASDQAGTALGQLFDFDADGFADLVIGAPGQDSGGTDAGAAYAIRGPLAGSISLADADGFLYGGAAGDSGASAISASGDVNGDGLLDLLIGAPESGTRHDGQAWLVLGPWFDTIDLFTADATFTGEASADEAGTAVASGDVDGDGYDDVLVGAPYADPGGSNSGAVYLLTGGSFSGTISLSEATARLSGEASLDSAGISISTCDVDANGYDDVLVGAYLNGTSADESGVAYIVFGPIDAGFTLPGSGAALSGEDAGDRAGRSTACLGDMNLDGQNDVLVGAENSDAGGTDAGAAYLVLGGTGP
jgi:hypothetical protein